MEKFCGGENVLYYTYCVTRPSTCFSLLERAQGDKISLQRQALIPIVSYTSRGGNIWVMLCSIITTFVASSAQMGLFLSRQPGLSRQHSEISLYNLKIILIGRTNIYLFCVWCSDLYCGKSSDPPIVIVLNISSLRGIKHCLSEVFANWRDLLTVASHGTSDVSINF